MLEMYLTLNVANGWMHSMGGMCIKSEAMPFRKWLLCWPIPNLQHIIFLVVFLPCLYMLNVGRCQNQFCYSLIHWCNTVMSFEDSLIIIIKYLSLILDVKLFLIFWSFFLWFLECWLANIYAREDAYFIL